MKEIFVAMMAATSPSDDVVMQHSIFSAFENMEQCEQYLVKEFSEYTDASLKKNGVILTLYVNGEDFGKINGLRNAHELTFQRNC